MLYTEKILREKQQLLSVSKNSDTVNSQLVMKIEQEYFHVSTTYKK